jgi:hypothetical protein
MRAYPTLQSRIEDICDCKVGMRMRRADVDFRARAESRLGSWIDLLDAQWWEPWQPLLFFGGLRASEVMKSMQ